MKRNHDENVKLLPFLVKSWRALTQSRMSGGNRWEGGHSSHPEVGEGRVAGVSSVLQQGIQQEQGSF